MLKGGHRPTERGESSGREDDPEDQDTVECAARRTRGPRPEQPPVFDVQRALVWLLETECNKPPFEALDPHTLPGPCSEPFYQTELPHMVENAGNSVHARLPVRTPPRVLGSGFSFLDFFFFFSPVRFLRSRR